MKNGTQVEYVVNGVVVFSGALVERTAGSTWVGIANGGRLDEVLRTHVRAR